MDSVHYCFGFHLFANVTEYEDKQCDTKSVSALEVHIHISLRAEASTG